MANSGDAVFPHSTVNLGPYIGAVLVGTCVTMALWGTALIQTIYFFFHNYPGDSWRLKALVLWTAGADTAHKCLIMVAIYKAVVSGEATSPVSFNALLREYILTILFMVLVSGPVQIYFTWRLWRFKTAVRWIFVGILTPAILGHFLMGIVVTQSYLSLLKKVPTETEERRALTVVVANLATEAGTDIILAVGLCALLWKTYLGVNFDNKPNSTASTMIRRLMLLSVNTGVLTAAFGIVAIAMFIRFPRSHLHIAICFIRAPIYSNMLLANLNARPHIRDRPDRIDAIEFNDIGGKSVFGEPSLRAASPEATNGMDAPSHGCRSVVRSRIHGATSEDHCGTVGAVIGPKDANVHASDNSHSGDYTDQDFELKTVQNTVERPNV